MRLQRRLEYGANYYHPTAGLPSSTGNMPINVEIMPSYLVEVAIQN